ncbi:MAG: gamma-glutamyl-gamma-aminobutyrate hydrolase family protein [Acidobacteriota bacterium]
MVYILRPEQMLRIAITDCSKYENYENWILRLDPYVECDRLSHRLNNHGRLRKCGGLVLTGGGDVHPRFYYHRILYKRGVELDSKNLAEKILKIMPPDEKDLLDGIDEKRDEFELKAIERALTMKIPLLGICRGLQIANVFFGGTLVRDLRANNGIHRRTGDRDKRHRIWVKSESLLAKLTGVDTGEVNSSHHQAAEDAGDSLIVSAKSDDGVIEALERKDGSSSGFLLLVQWHPERMEDMDNSLSRKVGLSFLSSIRA